MADGTHLFLFTLLIRPSTHLSSTDQPTHPLTHIITNLYVTNLAKSSVLGKN